MKAWFADHPLEVGGTDYDVEIIVKDAQSDSTRAGEVAAELINSDDVDVLISSGTPDIVNPVSEQCEANSIPCITTVAPWQPFAIRDGDKPGRPRSTATTSSGASRTSPPSTPTSGRR